MINVAAEAIHDLVRPIRLVGAFSARVLEDVLRDDFRDLEC